MPDTVKTSVIKSVREAVRGTTGIRQVICNPFATLDLETVRFPAVFLYDEPMRLERRNRYVHAELPLHLEIWHKRGSRHHLGDDVDELAAMVEMAILADEDVRLWCRDIVPDTEAQAKFFTDQDFGGIVLRYTVRFQYVWGDPFDHGRTA